MNMTVKSYSALGIEPGARVVGSALVRGILLLRARTITGKTRRYKACYDTKGNFKYFRQVTSSERKRLGRGEKLHCPLEELDWKRYSNQWIAHWGDLVIYTLTPTHGIVAPTDYSTYILNGELVSKYTLLKEIKI